MTGRRCVSALVGAAVLALAACSNDEPAEVSAPATDRAPERDERDESTASTPDTAAAPDTAPPDTAPPDTAPPDTAPPDTAPLDTEPSDTAPPADAASAPSTIAPLDAAASYDFSALDDVVDTFLAANDMNGAGLVIVDDRDGVIHEDYWGDFSADRISLVASSSKMVSAGVLMRLHDDGVLDVDAPVADVVDWEDAHPSITPAQLVSNSSGLPGLVSTESGSRFVCQFLPFGSLQSCAEGIFTTSPDDADIIAPDSEFRYGGAQWQVAGAVAEVASGKSWAELIDEIYVQPCQLDVLAYNNHFSQFGLGGLGYPDDFAGDPMTLRDTGNPNIEGGMYVTPGDYATLLLMNLRGGTCGDQQVLSEESLDRMHADRIAEVYGGDADLPDRGYGMGWWIDRDSGIRSDGGAYGSHPWLDLDDGYGAYLVVEATSDLGNALAESLYTLIDDAHAAAG